MKQILAGPLVAFDCETTGVSTEDDRIVSACLVLLQPGEPTWQAHIKTWLVDPGVDVPAEATAVHGMTGEWLKEHGTPAGTAVAQIGTAVAEMLHAGWPLVGCNISFDLTMLDRECRRHDLFANPYLHTQIAPVLDVYVLDKHLDPYRKGSRRLTDLCTWYNVAIAGAHDATFDALAAARVAFRIAQRSQLSNADLLRCYADPEHRHLYSHRHDPQEVCDRFLALQSSTLDELHTAQVTWRAEQQRSLKAFFAKEGKPYDDVREAWPVVPYRQPGACLREAADG